jgi:hypothetical protein
MVQAGAATIVRLLVRRLLKHQLRCAKPPADTTRSLSVLVIAEVL